MKTVLTSWRAIALCAICLIASDGSAQSKADGAMSDQELVKTTFGDVLLYDKDSGIVVSVKRDGNHLSSVTVSDMKNSKHSLVAIQMNVRPNGERPEIEYTAAMSDKPVQMAVWRDVNSDGVFDFRLLTGEWAQFNNETGPRAFIGGTWVKATRPPGEDQTANPLIMVAGKPYRFDFKKGKWELAPTAAPATQPAR